MKSFSSEDAEVVTVEPTTSIPSPVQFSKRRAYAQTFTATFAVRFLGILSGVLAARLLGPEGRGELAVIIFLPVLLISIGELELPRSLAYEVSRTKEVSPEVVATGFWLAVLLGCIQSIVLAAALPIYLPADKLHLLFAARWFVVYLPAAYINFALMGIDQGRGRFGRFSFLLSLPGFLYVIAIVIAWAAGRVLPQTLALGVLAGTMITAAVRALMDWRVIVGTKPNWTIASRLLKRGISYYLPAVTNFALTRSDMFLLVRLVSSEAIGLYAVAQAIALGQIGAVNPVVQVAFSAVAAETDPEQALVALARHFRLAQLLAITVGIASVLLTPWGIRIFFGARFLQADRATFLLIGATAFWGMEQVLEYGLRAASHPRFGILSNLVGGATVFAVGIPACLHFGIDGVAATMLAAQLINLSILIGFCILRLRMPAMLFWAFGPRSLREFWVTSDSLLRNAWQRAR